MSGARHTVILRDDDTNATTDPAHLERLFRPFLERGLPVSLAVIPEVRSDARDLRGQRERFLAPGAPNRNAERGVALPVATNDALVRYLRSEPGYAVVQHGLHHHVEDGRFELARDDPAEVARRLERGTLCLREAGLGAACAFVAPQDAMTPSSLREVARRFPVVSSGWYELARVPRRWWPIYLAQKKLLGRPHWQTAGTTFLTHPGNLLGPLHRPADALETMWQQIHRRRLTVLVTHHWELFGHDEAERIAALHELAERIAADRSVRVGTFREVASGRVTLW